MTETGKQIPLINQLYGIPYPHWDVVARIVPGALFLGMSWLNLLYYEWAESLWNTFHTTWYYWLGFLLCAYLVGHACDPLTRKLTELSASCHHKRGKGKRKPDHDKSWDEVLRYCLCNHSETREWISMDKAQVESRSLTNLGALCFLAAAMACSLTMGLGIQTLTSRHLLPQKWEYLQIALLVLSATFLWGGHIREGRRVWGGNALYLGDLQQT